MILMTHCFVQVHLAGSTISSRLAEYSLGVDGESQGQTSFMGGGLKHGLSDLVSIDKSF